MFSAPDAPEQFISQVTVLKYFSHYMEENLMDVSDVDEKAWNPLLLKACVLMNSSLTKIVCSPFQGGDLPSLTDVRRPRLYLLQWLKSDKALMMLFNDGTFQVGRVSSLSSPSTHPHMQLAPNM